MAIPDVTVNTNLSENRLNKKLQKALALASEVLGHEVEAPVETLSDSMAQAQAALNYFEARRDGFVEKACFNCGGIFAYCWDREGILYCSVTCMSKALEKRGMTWDPSKPPEKRWGKTIPAVVPPEALEVLQELVPKVTDDIDDLLAEFE